MDTIPPIRTVEDLPTAIQAASSDPSIRWYVVKKANSFRVPDMIPAEWGGVALAASVGEPDAALVAAYWDAVEADDEGDAVTAATRQFSSDVRERYAKQGIALPDGSFPIPDKDALRRAIQSIGRASDQGRARRHIIKRARALGATDMLPDDWKSGVSASVELVRERLLLERQSL